MSFVFKSVLRRLRRVERVIPKNWLPGADISGIVLHWTGGTNVANNLDRQHYNFLIEFTEDGGARIVRGRFKVTDQIPPLLRARYAAHTYMANSHRIGVGLCGMKGATEYPFNPGAYPIRQEQWDLACKAIAQMCLRYDLKVEERTVLTHAEVQDVLKIPQRQKWDITRLPFLMERGAFEIGEVMRKKVRSYARK